MVRSCLKLTPRSSSDDVSSLVSHECRGKLTKCVSFCTEGSEEVHVADEWDRTPVEVTPRLSYNDVLELKDMQMTLARTYKQAQATNFPHILSAVPIALLPLLPESLPDKMSKSPDKTNNPPAHPLSPPSTPPPPPPAPMPSTARRPSPKFTFLPLLDATSSGPPSQSLPTPTPTPAPPSPSNPYFPSTSTSPHPPAALTRPILQHKLRLHGLPSPTLPTPSPFSLYPPSPPLEYALPPDAPIPDVPTAISQTSLPTSKSSLGLSLITPVLPPSPPAAADENDSPSMFTVAFKRSRAPSTQEQVKDS